MTKATNRELKSVMTIYTDAEAAIAAAALKMAYDNFEEFTNTYYEQPRQQGKKAMDYLKRRVRGLAKDLEEPTS